KLILEEMGCTVAVASNGKQAVEMFRESTINAFNIFGRIHYDIILMDQMMPVMDGLTALQILKKEFKQLPPVIVLTADETFAQNDKYLEYGFDDCIIKPVKNDVLYQKIKELAGNTTSASSKEKLEVFSLESVEEKPVINSSTLNLIINNARQNNFKLEVLFESFFEDMDRIYQQSLSAIEMNDYNALRLIVMTVKGLSGNMGASQLHLVAKLMDRHIRNEQFEEATALIPLMTEKYTIFKSTVESVYLNEPIESGR
ncbi:MAG: response regulator, partial [Bacteroidota bacterium]